MVCVIGVIKPASIALVLLISNAYNVTIRNCFCTEDNVIDTHAQLIPI